MTTQNEGTRLATLLAWWSAERYGQPLTAEEYERIRQSASEWADSPAPDDEGTDEERR